MSGTTPPAAFCLCLPVFTPPAAARYDPITAVELGQHFWGTGCAASKVRPPRQATQSHPRQGVGETEILHVAVVSRRDLNRRDAPAALRRTTMQMRRRRGQGGATASYPFPGARRARRRRIAISKQATAFMHVSDNAPDTRCYAVGLLWLLLPALVIGQPCLRLVVSTREASIRGRRFASASAPGRASASFDAVGRPVPWPAERQDGDLLCMKAAHADVHIAVQVAGCM